MTDEKILSQKKCDWCAKKFSATKAELKKKGMAVGNVNYFFCSGPCREKYAKFLSEPLRCKLTYLCSIGPKIRGS